MSFPQLPWHEFKRQMGWQQGEHVTMIAPTGGGKTTLAREILPVRDYVAILATKKRDATLDKFRQDGYKATRKLPHPQVSRRAIITPPFPDDPSKTFPAHAKVFRDVLGRIYRDGYWTIYADEVRYLTDTLGLRDLFDVLLLQGRSQGISVVAATQRPRHIPLEFYSMPTHLFFWKDTDMQNVERLSEISGNLNKRDVMERLPQLEKHHFLYVNTRDDTVLESKVDL